MSIKIKGLKKVQAKLTTLSKSLEPSQMRRKMHTIGNMVHGSVEQSFEEEKSPFGQKWESRKKTKRRQSTKILRDTGDLADRWMVSATPNEVVVSNNIAWYGVVHQWGTKKAGRKKNVVIPARPFLPIDESGRLEPKLLKSLEEYLDDEIAKILR